MLHNDFNNGEYKTSSLLFFVNCVTNYFNLLTALIYFMTEHSKNSNSAFQ